MNKRQFKKQMKKQKNIKYMKIDGSLISSYQELSGSFLRTHSDGPDWKKIIPTNIK